MSTNPIPPRIQVSCEGGWSHGASGVRQFDISVVDANNGLTMFQLEIPEDAMVDLLTNSRRGKNSTMRMVAGTEHIGDVVQVAHVTVELVGTGNEAFAEARFVASSMCPGWAGWDERPNRHRYGNVGPDGLAAYRFKVRRVVPAADADTFPDPELLARHGITFELMHRSDRKDG